MGGSQDPDTRCYLDRFVHSKLAGAVNNTDHALFRYPKAKKGQGLTPQLYVPEQRKN